MDIYLQCQKTVSNNKTDYISRRIEDISNRLLSNKMTVQVFNKVDFNIMLNAREVVETIIQDNISVDITIQMFPSSNRIDSKIKSSILNSFNRV